MYQISRLHALSSRSETFLYDTWQSNLHLLCNAGVVTRTDIEAICDDVHHADLRNAAELIDEFEVAELKPLKPFLESMTAPRASDQNRSRGRFRFL
jgi:hypothetical protein